MLAIRAAMPKPPLLFWICRSALVSVRSAAVGKMRCRSFSTLDSSPDDFSTWPVMNSASRASGRIDSSMLYATIAERPVRLSR